MSKTTKSVLMKHTMFLQKIPGGYMRFYIFIFNFDKLGYSKMRERNLNKNRVREGKAKKIEWINIL